jgi:hypothetical protein
MEFKFVISAIESLRNDYNFFKIVIESKFCDPEVSVSTELNLWYNKLYIFWKRMQMSTLLNVFPSFKTPK